MYVLSVSDEEGNEHLDYPRGDASIHDTATLGAVL